MGRGMAGSTEPHIKGLAFHSVLTALESLEGPEAVSRALEAAGSVGRRIAHGEVVAASWAPVAWYREMWEGIASLGGGEALARRIGRASILADMNRVHRFMIRALSPATVTTVSARMWSRYFDTGGMKVESSSERYLRVRWHDCKGWSRMIWVEQFAGSEAFLELTGAKGVRLGVLEGGRDGDDFALTEATWR